MRTYIARCTFIDKNPCTMGETVAGPIYGQKFVDKPLSFL
jgi:hypothetical protein